MRIVECEQGTPEWAIARAGRVTASRICDVMAKIKSGEAASRRNYRAEIIAEILTGMPAEQYVSAEMQRGTEQEPFARAAYEVRKDVMVDQLGFILHPTIERSGGSPDGLVGTDGMVEIKCPNTATHIGYILSGTIPSEYQLQMQWNMACAERSWSDFVSYDSRLPDEYQLFIVRMERDEKRIAEIGGEVESFLAEVDSTIAALKQRLLGESLEEQLTASIAQTAN